MTTQVIRKAIVDRLNRLETALRLADIKGDEGSIREINDEIHALRQKLKNLTA